MSKLKLLRGFTLIELLIVVTIIGVLAGVGLTIISPQGQRNRAEDGVRLANIEKAVQGIEAYRSIEGSYPILAVAGDPTTLSGVDTYISTWPDDQPLGSTYAYWSDGAEYGVAVMQSDNTNAFKYYSTWPNIETCVDVFANSSGCATQVTPPPVQQSCNECNTFANDCSCHAPCIGAWPAVCNGSTGMCECSTGNI